MILEISDLDSLKENALKAFDERLSKADCANVSGIQREVARLESQLEQLYSFTALMAQRETDMATTAELWARLARICDVFAERVHELSEQFQLGNSVYDNMLEIRAAAEELRVLHSP